MRSKKAILNVGSNLVLQIVVIIYGFIVPKIIISSYGSGVNGLVSSITQFLAYIALLDSGFTAVIKSQLYKPIARKDNRTITQILKASDKFFKRIAYIFIVYIMILSVVYPLLINKDYDFTFTFILVIILSTSSLAEYYFGMVYKIFLQADQKSYVISCIQIITYILSIIFVIILAKYRVSVIVLKLVTSVFFILRPILQNIYVKRKYNLRFENVVGDYKIKNKWDGFAQHIASVIHGSTDITVLTIFKGLMEVSIYSVYALVTSGIRKIIQSFTSGIDSSFGDMIAKEEIDKLNNGFKVYELLYNTISIVMYSLTLILIIPFISIYTKGIEDCNYVIPLFGYLLVLSEYIWAIRQPYNELVKAAGHFKETKKGAWVECIVNVIVSILLVIKYGIIGVAIGTIVSMGIRAIDLVNHANKYILRRSNRISIKNFIIVIIDTLIIVFISKYITILEYNGYFNWIINSLIFAISSIVVVGLTDYLLYKEQILKLFDILRRVFRRKNDK